MTAPAYQRMDRNIVQRNGRLEVMIFRNRRVLFAGGFADLPSARAWRDVLERRHPARLPWALTPKKTLRRSTAVRRAEWRAAGLCQMCGEEPPKAGLLSCAVCRQIVKLKACGVESK